MAIILAYGNNKVEKVSLKEQMCVNVYNHNGKADIEVYSFLLTNDNYSHYCPAHSKFIETEEMIAIYEYMKKNS